LSFIELSIPDPGLAGRASFGSTIDLWDFAVRQANEACLVLDNSFTVVAASPGCAGLLSVVAADAVGRRLLDVLPLLDFNTAGGRLPKSEVDKIPPLAAISTGMLARGLLRVPGPDNVPTTVDAISVPLRDPDGVAGSLTFFAPVGR
jgi:hypothetical protein